MDKLHLWFLHQKLLISTVPCSTREMGTELYSHQNLQRALVHRCKNYVMELQALFTLTWGCMGLLHEWNKYPEIETRGCKTIQAPHSYTHIHVHTRVAFNYLVLSKKIYGNSGCQKFRMIHISVCSRMYTNVCSICVYYIQYALAMAVIPLDWEFEVDGWGQKTV